MRKKILPPPPSQILGTPLESVTAIFNELGWHSLSKRRGDAKLILFYKIINNLAKVPHGYILINAYEGSSVVGRERMGTALPHKKLSGNGVPTREILRDIFLLLQLYTLTAKLSMDVCRNLCIWDKPKNFST